MRSRSKRGSTSAIYSPVNEASVTLARSEPEPLTHRIRARRPRKSTSSALAEVLPPPQLQIERSAPSLRERATSCANTVGTETSVIVLKSFFLKLYRWAPLGATSPPSVILSATKDLSLGRAQILRCAQDDKARW